MSLIEKWKKTLEKWEIDASVQEIVNIELGLFKISLSDVAANLSEDDLTKRSIAERNHRITVEILKEHRDLINTKLAADPSFRAVFNEYAAAEGPVAAFRKKHDGKKGFLNRAKRLAQLIPVFPSAVKAGRLGTKLGEMAYPKSPG